MPIVTFDEFVQSYGTLFADKELREHLNDTVFLPAAAAAAAAAARPTSEHNDEPQQEEVESNQQRQDRLSRAAEALWRSHLGPPKCTNVRVFKSPSSTPQSNNDATMGSPANDDQTVWSTTDMSAIGLSECRVIAPVEDAAVASSSTALLLPLLLVLDVGCGEAVLRGSNVFTPGILGSSGPYEVGDAVSLVCCADPHAKQILKNSFVNAQELMTSSSPLYVCVGRGVMVKDRRTVVSGDRGVAVHTTWNPARHPSSEALQQTVAMKDSSCSEGSRPLRFFLQNWSSMLPALLLDARPGHTVLDACAAPGGKASHVVARLLSSSSSSQRCSSDTAAAAAVGDGSASLPLFRLICCERSAARCRSLQSLLVDHHGPQLVASQQVQVVQGDVLHLLDHDLRDIQFDRIVLDPPCTGLGLRPRLLPHPHTLLLVQRSAEFQQALLRRCWASLKSGGRLSYSTCTISVEENEAVVAWALATLPGARLAECQSPSEAHLMKVVRQQPWYGVQTHSLARLGLPTLSPTALCCRVGPSTDARWDGVGFFVAILEKAV